MTKDRQFVESFSRGLSLLEAISREQRALSNSELARSTGLAPSTVSRLTHTAVSLGYLKFNSELRAYELTPKNLMFSYRVLMDMSVIEVMRPLLKDLREQSGQTVGLVVRDGMFISFIDIVPGSDIVAVRLQVGARLPIFMAAAGYAIISAMEEKESRLIASRVRSEIHKRDGDIDKFNSVLAETKETGVAIIRDGWRRGIGGVSMAIPNSIGPMAISIPVSSGCISKEEMRGILSDQLSEMVAKAGTLNLCNKTEY